ncbi:sterol desaturase family protein [Variovorax robiniae]|uniref:Sterol desaturase family protein n=1 Tax=Variovorax robiniae TaxID=1836199 RepID=A0ABU8X464_9BURK
MSALLSHPLAFKISLFLLLVMLFGLLEWLWAARQIEWRKVLVRDLVAQVFGAFVVAKAAFHLNLWLHVQGAPWPEAIEAWPFPVRLLLYLMVADFGAYWMHRLVHIGVLWRVHRWHHSPTHMYWLAGNRGSILQQALFNVPYILAGPLISTSPWWMVSALFILNALTNAWMHMNVRWKLGWLDWLLVTPRTHEIHHSDNPAHYNSNFGVLLSVWDRMFGTYRSPKAVDSAALKFGIPETVPLGRLVIGI